MSNANTIASSGYKESAIDRSQLVSALRELKPKTSVIDDQLSSVWQEISEALNRGVTQRAVIAALAERGLSITYPRFRKFLAASKVGSERSGA